MAKPNKPAQSSESVEYADLPTVGYCDIGKHNRFESARVVYRGLVYDITDFLRLHPGGKSILLAALGSDITETVDSHHDAYVGRLLESQKYRCQYGIRLIGRLSEGELAEGNRIGFHQYQSRRQYECADAFTLELRKEVFAYLRERRLPLQKPLRDCIALTAFFYCLYVLGVYMAFIRGSTVWCGLLGPIFTFMAVNVAHTVMHGGFSDSRILEWLGRSLWDLGGYSARCWDIEHQNHHQAPHTTIDSQTAHWSVVRFFEHQEFTPIHRLQMIYIWPALVLYSPSSWIGHTYKTLRYSCVPWYEKLIHVGAKCVGFVLPICLSFYYWGAGPASLNLLVFIVSMSYSAIFLLFIQHEDSYLPEDQSETWAVRQVATSVSWYTNNRVLEWLLGYFNYHIEHHLFPGLNPSLYPKIQPIVRAVCLRHGIRYKHVSYWELVSSQVRAWKKYSMGLSEIMNPLG